MAALGKSGNHVSLGFPTLLRLHRFLEAVALPIHLENLRVVGQTVQKSRRHPLALEDLVPLAERKIARHQDAATLVAVGEDSEQEFLTVTDFGGVDVGTQPVTRTPTGSAANCRDSDVG